MPILQKSCIVCGPLDVTAKILAILQLIGMLLNALIFGPIICWVVFSLGGHINKFQADLQLSFDEASRDLQGTDAVHFNTAQSGFDVIKTYIAAYLALFKAIALISEVLFVVQVVTLSMLIHGIKHERAKLVMPWMITQAISLIFGIIFFITILGIAGSSTPVNFGLSLPVSFIIGIWFLIVAYSYYQQLNEQVVNRNDMNMK